MTDIRAAFTGALNPGIVCKSATMRYGDQGVQLLTFEVATGDRVKFFTQECPANANTGALMAKAIGVAEAANAWAAEN